MSDVRMMGCLHLGHKSIAEHRGFNSIEAHDEYLIKNWNSIVKKRDITYILGDVTFENKDYYFKLNLLNGRKIVVLGNHDKYKDIPELLKYVDGVAGAIKYKGFMLTHVPIHPNEVLLYRGNIHAHLHHENTLQELSALNNYKKEGSIEKETLSRYHNVDAKLIDFKPKSIKDLLS